MRAGQVGQTGSLEPYGGLGGRAQTAFEPKTIAKRLVPHRSVVGPLGVVLLQMGNCVLVTNASRTQVMKWSHMPVIMATPTASMRTPPTICMTRE